ncbi:hypothetical protein Tco_1413438 [Tanacetum coccineum]
MVAYLEKSTGSAGFHQIIDFINRSHICYALTKKPEVCVSFIKQFWRTAEIVTNEDGNVKIHATVDGHSLSITEGSIRRHLKLDDKDGLISLPSSEIFAQLALMGFIQLCLDMQRHKFQQHSRFYSVPSLTMKVFSNMKRSTKGFSGQEVPLFSSMIDADESSPSPSTPTSSPTPEPSPTQPSPPHPSPSQHSPTQPGTEYHPPTPHDSPLHAVHSHGSEEGSLKLQELMGLITTLSDRIGVLEADLSKTKKIYSSAYTKLTLRVKKLESQIKGRKFSNEGFQDDEGVHEKASTETELFIQEKKDYSSETVPPVSNVKYKLVLLGGMLLTQGEVQRKEKMNEEQRAQIARDAEIARQWEEEEKKKAMDEAKTAKFVPMDAEKERTKSPEKERSKSPEKERTTEKIVEEEAGTQEERKEAVNEPAAKRKKSIPRKTTRKRQKLEVETEKEELKTFLDIVPREEAPIDIESLSTKFPIVDWKTIVLTETYMYYQVFRGDGSSKNYKVLSEMLEDFDRMDVEQLFRLVKERYSTTAPEGYDLMLWGDLHTLFEHDENDEIWRDQHEYKLLSWRLCDFCGIHILLMENGLAIHMLTEKKYPLSQEMLSKMLSKRLEVDHESSQAFELLKFIRAQVQK